MTKKWADIRKGPPPEPLSPEEHRAMAERLARLDKFCEGMEDELQWELLEPAHRYTRGEITFEEFEKYAARLSKKPPDMECSETSIGHSTTVREVCGEKKQTDILDLFGTIEFDPSYDVRKSRNLDKLEDDK